LVSEKFCQIVDIGHVAVMPIHSVFPINEGNKKCASVAAPASGRARSLAYDLKSFLRHPSYPMPRKSFFQHGGAVLDNAGRQRRKRRLAARCAIRFADGRWLHLHCILPRTIDLRSSFHKLDLLLHR
jgi:hypothetical protein